MKAHFRECTDHPRWLLAIVGVAVSLRVGAALYLGNTVVEMPGIADQLSYHSLAVRVLEGHGFSFASNWWPATAADQPTAHWSFLYVLFLAGIYAVVGPMPIVARLIQAVLVGVLQPLITHRIGRRIFGPRVGLVSAAMVACYAYFVYYAGAIMTESFCIVAILWSLHVALRIGMIEGRHRVPGAGLWLQLGLALATAVLLRQAVLLVVPVILGWAAWRSVHVAHSADGAKATVRPLAGVALAVVVIAAAILPWTIRNQRAFEQFVLLNTNAGFAFYWGNHPVHGTDFVPILPASEYGRLIPDELRGLNEAALDKALLARGLGFVVSDPGRYLRLSVSRLKEHVRFWPSEESGMLGSAARLLSFGLFLPVLVFGILLALGETRPARSGAFERSAGVLLLLAFAAVYSAMHILTWTLVRYRLPVDALLMPFGALSITWAWDRVLSVRSLRPTPITPN